ncbi:MAG: hypothetical protein ACOCTI_01645 [Phycisphaeraceae bacterium]
MSEEEFASRLTGLVERRRTLLALLRHHGRSWDSIFSTARRI